MADPKSATTRTLELTRVFMAIEFESAERITTFLNSDDVRKGRFGDNSVDSANPNIRQLIQPDGFRISTMGTQIQINYELPNEARDDFESAMEQAAIRWKRTISTLSSIKDGKAKWVGIQFFLDEPVENAKSLANALDIWKRKVGFCSGLELAGLNLMLAVYLDGLFEGITVQAYETRGGFVKDAPSGVLDSQQFPFLSAGIQYIIDINTKPKAALGRVSDLVLEITNRMKERQSVIINRAMNVLLHGGASA